MSEVKIICIIPCYNAENTIAKAIESIINQDYTNWKLIIVDDASTDKSVKIIKKYLKNPKITLLQNKTNRGCYYSRNRALYYVKDKKWDWFTVHDSDDTSHPDRFKIYVDHILEGNYDYIFGIGQGNRYDSNTGKIIFKCHDRNHGTSFISYNLFKNTLGYFDTSQRFGADSQYQYRYKVIVGALFTEANNKLIQWEKVQQKCVEDKRFITNLPLKYSYLYTMGYTWGNNLTQKYSSEERNKYQDSFIKEYAERPFKEFYQDFTPHKEDL